MKYDHITDREAIQTIEKAWRKDYIESHPDLITEKRINNTKYNIAMRQLAEKVTLLFADNKVTLWELDSCVEKAKRKLIFTLPKETL